MAKTTKTTKTTQTASAYWQDEYTPAPEYKTKVAYFCMEFAVDQSLKIYSGGLGFLAGSHLRSAFQLKQNFVAVGMLWKYGYYDQARHADQSLRVQFTEKHYPFLVDTGIVVSVPIHNNPHVYVKAYYLPPHVFGTAPLYLLSTDLPENDHLARTITERLYDNNTDTRIAQSIVLGIGGGKVIEKLGGADIYHINEGHALPLAFYLKNNKFKTEEELRKHFVFTTHTPELAGNEEHNAFKLNDMRFFEKELSTPEILKITNGHPSLNYTVTALRCAKLANGVSKLHGEVAREMWKDYDNICPIIHITNAQDKEYWGDKTLLKAWEKGSQKEFSARKQELKKELFDIVADQTGKLFKPEVLTIVWARRFAAYKRPDLLLRFKKRFLKLVQNKETPIQIIWAGKPYPTDGGAVHTFNRLIQETRDLPNCAVLTGYELRLSHDLKLGADVWLNTPRRPREASGTSGMTAGMNGGVNVSIFDGWICEFVKHGVNGYTVPATDMTLPTEKQDDIDAENILDVLEKEVIPAYYDAKGKWWEVVKTSVKDVLDFFESDRMADEYYKKLYDVQ